MDALSLEMQIVKNEQTAKFKYHQILIEKEGIKRSVLEIQRNKIMRDNAKARRWLQWAKQ